MTPFDWKAYLVFADANAGRTSEAMRRIVVSRAYYAVFNTSRHWLESQGHSFGRRDVHQRVWDAFKSAERAEPASAPDWRVVAAHGKRLQKLRNAADYDDVVPHLDAEVPRALEAAHVVVDELLPRLRIA